MKDYELRDRMKVLIPTQKTAGNSSLGSFLINFNIVNTNNQDHLYLAYYNLYTNQCYLSLRENGSDVVVNRYSISHFAFRPQDLEAYDKSEQIKENNRLRYNDYQNGLLNGDSTDETPEVEYVAGQALNTDYKEGYADNPGPVLEMIPVHEDAILVDDLLDENMQLPQQQPVEADLFANTANKLGINKDKDKFVEAVKEGYKGLRYNEGKLDYTLMDLTAFSPMIEVLEFGAKKYSRDNWKAGGNQFTLLKMLGSTMRHLALLLSGELYDQESGLSHIGHLQCNLMFIGYFWNEHLKNKKSKKKSNFLKDLPKQK